MDAASATTAVDAASVRTSPSVDAASATTSSAVDAAPARRRPCPRPRAWRPPRPRRPRSQPRPTPVATWAIADRGVRAKPRPPPPPGRRVSRPPTRPRPRLPAPPSLRPSSRPERPPPRRGAPSAKTGRVRARSRDARGWLDGCLSSQSVRVSMTGSGRTRSHTFFGARLTPIVGIYVWMY